VCIDARGNVS